ncbi:MULTISPECIES: hypothetical protein [Aneurinibacillus]|uniref:Glycosyltransferase RgtA/B/C/D-like domain-containing protein n=1 Tax=Aneurinibacillus thermoaerophilus TaxID=143495 RepID=A0A1G8D446_ANETH|nr:MULTISPECIES: hypothetical protein [Aneurinibacillus]AMA74268.1 hypothetical protein ACH33_16610 [Aneurinibacillus sp. XH2]MED0675748.1 hypothetical protein [Aneurinibacillus thermoaerophilus]MED0680710.1 hypothetical protein [Aneurinibacillus thermoaerophilus]MED0736790.1 hypothetical protein [Aneurinibacillus thermoaerophilus]MED0758884.1 hypothetical protein [Aneurinibacillus thermoaerophilus]
MGEKKKLQLLPWFWFLFGAAMALKYGYEKFRYYPVLDDWIQYGAFQLYDDPFRQIFLNYSYHTRPLASLFDLFVWGKFWPNLAGALVIITALHTASCYLLYRIFDRLGLPLGTAVAIIFGLLPLGSEATYWLSASSRLVVGLFLMLLSLYLLVLSFEQKKKIGYVAGFVIVQLLSFGFYEQIIALGAACSFLIMLWKQRWRLLWLPILNVGFIGIYYVVFKEGGNTAERGQLVPWERLLVHTGGVFHEFYDIVVLLHTKFYSIGFGRGLSLLLKNHSYLYLFLITIVALTIGWLAFRMADKESRLRRPGVEILLGIIIAVVPLSPFFILDKSGLALRNVFPSFIGLALLVDGLLLLIVRKRVGRAVYGMLIASLTFIFTVVNVAEIVDYKNVSQADRYIAEQIIALGKKEHKINGKYPVYLFGAEPQMVQVGVSFLNHVRNATSSDWAMAGVMRAVGQNRYYPSVTPVSVKKDIIIASRDMERGLILGLEPDLTVVPLRPQKKRNGDYHLVRPDGTRFGIYFTSKQYFRKW